MCCYLLCISKKILTNYYLYPDTVAPRRHCIQLCISKMILTNDSDISGSHKVCLVSHEYDGLVVGRSGPPEVLQDLLGHVERLVAHHAVHDHHRVRHVSGKRILNLQTNKKTFSFILVIH